MATSSSKSEHKSPAKKAPAKTVKKSSYDQLKANGWNFLLKRLSPGEATKLKAM